MMINLKHRLALTLLGIAGVVVLLAGTASSPQVVNPHASEPIGTVAQIYDGALLPDLQSTPSAISTACSRLARSRRGQPSTLLPSENRALGRSSFTQGQAVRSL